MVDVMLWRKKRKKGGVWIFSNFPNLQRWQRAREISPYIIFEIYAEPSEKNPPIKNTPL